MEGLGGYERRLTIYMYLYMYVLTFLLTPIHCYTQHTRVYTQKRKGDGIWRRGVNCLGA